MRVPSVFACVLLLGLPAVARPQRLLVSGSAGPTLVDRGYSVAAGVGWMPWPRVTLSANLERTELASRVRTDARGGTSAFRGGAVTLGTAELQVSLWSRARVTPYVLTGIAAGVSRPTVNATFPDRVTNDVRAVLGGAGLHVPLRPRLGLVVDARLLIGEDANELLAVAPLRVGLNWQF